MLPGDGFKMKILSLISLLLLYKEAACAIWRPFHTGIADVVLRDGIAKGYFASELLCLAWMNANNDANLACYNLELKLCSGYKVALPVSGSDEALDDWKCFKTSCPYSIWGAWMFSRVLDSVIASEKVGPLDEGRDLCPSGYVRFSPCNILQFERMRRNLKMRKAQGTMPSDLQIGMKMNAVSKKWHNTEFGDYLFDTPDRVGQYPFYTTEPNNDNPCGRLHSADYFVADKSCDYSFQALCVESFGL